VIQTHDDKRASIVLVYPHGTTYLIELDEPWSPQTITASDIADIVWTDDGVGRGPD
jgi:hypothetical protein